MASTFSFLHTTHYLPPPMQRSRLPSKKTSRRVSTIITPSFRNKSFTSKNSTRSVTTRSQLNVPIISPQDQWGTWTALFATGAFGIWSEKTKIGSMLSGALVSTLIGLVASNLGIIASEAPAYKVVLEYLMPLAVPLLLYRADMNRVMRSTGNLLLAFLLGSVATTVGTVVAFLMVPMRSLGQDGWKIAAALMGRHIGGGGVRRIAAVLRAYISCFSFAYSELRSYLAFSYTSWTLPFGLFSAVAVNYVAISEALQVSPSVLAAGLAADNVLCAVYFTTLFALASRIPAEPSSSTAEVGFDEKSASGNKLPVLQTATALAVSFAICTSAGYFIKYFGIQGGSLPVITAIVVVLATIFPDQFAYLAPSSESMALILMQVFFTVIGASGSIRNVISTAPSIFLFSLVQITVHLAFILGLGKLFGFELRSLLIASNANVGGPTTACGMATAKGWSSLIIPGILAGIFGIAIATFLGIAFGQYVLKFM